MSRADELLADFIAASGDLAASRRALVDEQLKAQHGMPHSTMFAASREHVAFHRWLGIGEALAVVAPKPSPKAPRVTPPFSKPAHPIAPSASNKRFDLIGHLNDLVEIGESNVRSQLAALAARNKSKG